MELSRRDVLMAGAAGLGLQTAATATAAEPAKKPLRIGLLSAAIHGKPQPRKGHTWHFCQYLHPEMDLEACKNVYPQFVPGYEKVYRNPKYNFDVLPFPDTRITHYYDADPAVAADFCKVFPGVEVAKSPEQLAN